MQVDTVFVSLAPGHSHKHFTAYDPVVKWTVAGVARCATANLAAAFLDKLLADMPFKVTGIQVDGGSEFKADFETACQAKNLALYVLPPKRPQLNGAVERCNGAWRYEFYAAYDLPHRLDKLQPLIDAFAHLQPPQASRRPRRQNSSRVSQCLQLGDPAVSHVLNPDKDLLSRPLRAILVASRPQN